MDFYIKRVSIMKKYLLPIILAALITACATQQVEPEKEYVLHTVKYQGETLGKISAWYTGSAKNWSAIQDANPELIANKMKPGITIKIPKELTKREDGFSKKYITPEKKPVVEAPKAESTPVESESPSPAATTPEEVLGIVVPSVEPSPVETIAIIEPSAIPAVVETAFPSATPVVSPTPDELKF